MQASLRSRLLTSAALLAFAPACSSCEAGTVPNATNSAAAPAASAPPTPPAPATQGKPVTFASEDGATLAGELFAPADPTAPIAVLVHRRHGDSKEFAPLIERLMRSPRRYMVIAFDLRGHGASKPPAKAKPKVGVLEAEQFLPDVRAAIRHALEASGQKARGVVLIGSSLGAALVAKVAWTEPKVTALGLVSPGAAIDGFDIYRPYAEVRNLPTFLAGATEDTVTREPLDALSRMAQNGTVKRYTSAMHAAGWLGDKHPELWPALEDWHLSVYDAPLVERRSLYYAPGKEPRGPRAQQAEKSKGQKRTGAAP
jgi:pimeloyl-ACP methyl ester carboxylesterase